MLSGQALLANAGEVRGVQLDGILPEQERKVVDYASNLEAGSLNDLKPNEFNIILGSALAKTLEVNIGNKVTVITPEGNVTPAGVAPRLKQFNVVGIVKTGVEDADNVKALIHLEDAKNFIAKTKAACPYACALPIRKTPLP